MRRRQVKRRQVRRPAVLLLMALWLAASTSIAQADDPTDTPPPAAAASDPPPSAPPSDQPPPPVSQAIKDRPVLQDDPYAAARPGNAPVDPDMKGYFTLPGTTTRMRFGGFAKVDVIHDFDPAGNPDAFVTSTIPVGPTPSSDNTNISIRQSRLNFDLRRPLQKASDGDLRFFFEFDFMGSGGANAPLLRHLYGQAKNILAGYSFTTLMDADSLPDTLDYEGPGSMVYMLQPQIRYTKAFSGKTTLAFAVERGTSDIVTEVPSDPAIVITPTSPWPDGIVRYRYEAETWHLQAGVVLRSVGGYTSTLTEGHVPAGGLSVASVIQVRKGDSLLLQGNFGRGMGRYIEDLTGLAADVGVDEKGDLVALPVAAGFAAWQHAWSEALRSSLVWGRIDLDSVDKTFTTSFHISDYTAVNLIWNPAGTSFNMGIEYLYGRQELNTGEWGDAHRLQFSFQYDLVR
jgi:hypothetical protein